MCRTIYCTSCPVKHTHRHTHTHKHTAELGRLPGVRLHLANSLGKRCAHCLNNYPCPLALGRVGPTPRQTQQTQQTMRPCAICHMPCPPVRAEHSQLGGDPWPVLSINNFSTKVAHVQPAPPAECQLDQLYQLPSILSCSLQSTPHLAAPSWQLTNGFGSCNCAINYFTSNSLRNDF